MQIGDRLAWFWEQQSYAYSCISRLLRRFAAGEDCLPTDVFEREAVSRYTWLGLGTTTLSCCRPKPVLFDLVSIMERAADGQKALAALEAYASGLMGQQNSLATLLGYPDVETLRSAENGWGEERPKVRRSDANSVAKG